MKFSHLKILTVSLILIFSAILAACEGTSAGVETGNPRGRKISGQLTDTDFQSSALVRTLKKSQPSYAGTTIDVSNVNQVEARATDLSEVITADVEDLRFEMSVDPEKSYVFVLYYNEFPLTHLAFYSDECGTYDYRVVVGGGEDDVDLGLIFPDLDGAHAEINPSASRDTDSDGIVDTEDSDMNGDGLEDFDGNFDHFIDVNNSDDTGQPGTCDITNIAEPNGVRLGAVFTNDGIQNLEITANASVTGLTTTGFTIYNVDDATDVDLTDALSATISGSTISLQTQLEQDKDYVLTIPAGAMLCGSNSLERDVTYYFRALGETNIAVSVCPN